ncbi:tripartite tricarboxylate transporter TctB family protein [Desulfosporosinus sp. BICA1-9]|uniref:tripartite tricarboxylate transporter TctB family protein n=1 Tax=Desulfosporosinus sp. BICA1-9 TaxID=1531958 RepID=UPI00054BCD90|nr:tripartite tricarboxylate transporter TctB family protein [Desulfosporosinus sp. BICA1-9]KJS48817.1 MAG: hypothetical protein VR66_11810 [Peptococcaceae bacterium BRH_c23]KJS87093.1 MAG: hypothetical protein JL57_15080 [Desulfosporosinus sp. BICA1-9]HBW34159.1 hypothetical protein [Desulfosporosinus sp.]
MLVRIKGSVVFAFVLFLFFIVFIGIALTYNQQARMVPLVIGIPSLLLSAGVLWNTWSNPKPSQSEKESKIKKVSSNQELLITFAWFFALLILVYLFGFLFVIPIFLLAYLRLAGKESWVLSIAISLSAWLVIMILFVMILKVDLYKGIIMNLL